MADMEDFLGKVALDAINGGKDVTRIATQDKLIGQRNLNIIQQGQITDNKEYIRSLEAEIHSLKSQLEKERRQNSGPQGLGVQQWKELQAHKNKTPTELINEGRIQTEKEYQALLSKPFQEIASQNGNFKKTYEAQMELMADWMVSQKAFKELAIEFGFDAHGYTPEQVIEMGLDKGIDVLEDKNDPSHNTIASNSTIIAPRKEKLVEKYHRDKATRKAKKGS